MGTERPVPTRRARPGPRVWTRPGLRLAGGGLLIATGAIHLDLYLTGYRSIPTIGGLFLLQVIVAFVLGAVVLASPILTSPALASAEWFAAAAGAVFVLATLGGYLLSLWIGLFGFKEVRTTAGIAAGVVEVTAFAALASLAATASGDGPALSGLPGRLLARVPGGGRVVATSVAAVCVAALAVLGASLAVAGTPAATSAGNTLKAAHLGNVTVLTNARGFTLYRFAPDTATRSACYGTCAAYWPPVKGPATAGPGVTGRLSTITRSDGTIQATYDGHPLYTYVGDSAPGQAGGNGLNLNGGLWHEVTASG